METQRAEPTVTLPPWSVEEASLLRDARAGDLQAFEQLVQYHQAGVFAAASRHTERHADAVELALETFVALYGALPRISNPAHLARWLPRAVAQRAPGGSLQSTTRDDVLVVEAADGDAPIETPDVDFTARVMVRLEQRWSHRQQRRTAASSGSRGRRRIVWCVLLVVIVALAVLALRWAGLLWPTVVPLAPSTATASVKAAAPAAVAAAQTRDVIGVPTVAPAAPGQPPLNDAYPRYTVIVMPLQQQSQDAAVREPAESFHAALLEELRKVPGMALLVPGVTAPPMDAVHPADYLLTVTSLDTTTLASGGIAYRVPGGGTSDLLSTTSGRQWPVEIRMQSLAQPDSRGFSSTVQLGATDSAAQLAAKQVEMLRVRFFPDVFLRQQLTARLRDGASSSAERDRALFDLIGNAAAGRAPALDAASIGALIQQTTVMRADQRAQLWRSLRGGYYPDLVGPLLDALRREPEDDVRFEALATLAANYSGDADVRAAIETATREDPQQLVRMAARRALNGESEWRNFVLATLRDASLPYADRLAPLLLGVRSAVTPTETAAAKTLVTDAETQGLLAGMVRDGWFDGAQVEAVGDVLGLLADGGTAPALDLVVQVMPEITKPAPAPSAAPAPAPAPQLSQAAMAWLQNHRNNPRVRRMLDDIARGDPDPRLESVVEQMRRAEQMQRPPLRR